jgi:hypothetical protein
MSQTFRTRIRRGTSKNVTGIVIPPEIIEAMGHGRCPPVAVTLNGYTYRSTVASMGGHLMVGLSAEHREAAGLTGDEELTVTVAYDASPRDVVPPPDLQAALEEHSIVEAFAAAASWRRREFVRLVESAKKPETRARRVAKIVDSLLTARGP